MDREAFPWGRIQLDALERGELVYAMNEGWAALSQGVGYALCWIGLRAWDQDYPFSLCEEPIEGPVSEGVPSEAGRDQAVASSFGDNVLRRFETVLRQYGMHVNDRRYMQTTQPINARLVLGRISYGEGLYYFEMRRSGGVHALAVQREGDRYRLFDCHYGHFSVDGLRNFANFIERFLSQAGYGHTYDMSTTVAGANAVARWQVLERAARAPVPPVAVEPPPEQRTIRAVSIAR